MKLYTLFLSLVLIAVTTFSQPVINSFSPLSGPKGTSVSIRGSNFTGAGPVKFGGSYASRWSVLTDSTMVALVGDGPGGNLNVTGPNGTGFGQNYTFVYTYINSFEPQTGGPGTLITIYGSGFTGATAVSFGGIPAVSFTVNSDTIISAISGIGTIGEATVTTAYGIATKSVFIAPPIINQVTPGLGAPGTLVNITGNNFAELPTGNAVYFGNVKANITASTSSSLSVIVPAGTSYLPVSITANGLIGYSALPFTTTFNGGPLIPASFDKEQAFGSNFTPINVAMGDLDIDGKPELVTANSNGSLSLFKNNSTPGNLLFSDPLNYQVNAIPGSGLIIADFTGDGLPDIAILNYYHHIISVFKNISSNGVLSLAPKVDFMTGTNPNAIAVADINGDGKTDIVVVNNTSQTVSIFRNTGSSGSIAFAPRVNYATGRKPYGLALADLDKDGKIDIAVTNETDATISIFKNIGTSESVSFNPKVDYVTGPSPRIISTGDLDGDGDIDLLTGNFDRNNGTMSIFKNISSNGSISLNSKVDFSFGQPLINIAINDMDGDGKPDISYGKLNTSIIGILKNTGEAGNINFGTEAYYPTADYPGINITGDLDMDGKPDIAIVDGRLAVLRNKFNEAPLVTGFSPAYGGPGDTIVITGKKLTGVMAASLGDSAFISFKLLSDTAILAILGNGNSGEIRVTTVYGTAVMNGFTFITPPVITSFSPLSGPLGATVTITGRNFNPSPAANMVFFGTARAQVVSASGNNLMVIVPPGANNNRISVTNNNRRTAWSTQKFNVTFSGAGPTFLNNYFDTTIRIPLPGIQGGLYFRTGDMEGDGKTDLVVLHTNGNTRYLSTFKNNTSGKNILFGPRIDHPNSAGIIGSPFVIDVNGDGFPEVLIERDIEPSSVTFFKNTSTPNTISLATDLTASFPAPGGTTAYFGDFDEDGRTDLIIKSFYKPGIEVFRNTSTGDSLSFAAPVLIGVANGSYVSGGSVLVEDFSGDGKLDIAVVNEYSVSMFKNIGVTGRILFSPLITFPAVRSNLGIAADFDGDGRIDIAKLNFEQNAVSLLRNNSTGGNISFETFVDFPLGFAPDRVMAADLDGDARPDICINSDYTNTFSILKNNCTPGVLAFATKVDFKGAIYRPYFFTDIDNDGKLDMLTANSNGNSVNILRNTIGEPSAISLCPPMANTLVTSDLAGTSYQWQANTGEGFSNIFNNSNYTNTNTGSLQLNNIPSSWNGYEYRCIVDGTASNIFKLKFSNSWLGTVNTAWENPANWSCGSLPDANTDVFVPTGNITISSNITVRSLKVNQGATITINGGFKLTVLK